MPWRMMASSRAARTPFVAGCHATSVCSSTTWERCIGRANARGVSTGALTVFARRGAAADGAFTRASPLRTADGTIVVGGNVGWRLPDGRRLELVEDGKPSRPCRARAERRPGGLLRDEVGRPVITLSWVGPRDKPLDIGRADLAPSLVPSPKLVPFLVYAFHRFAKK